jgi:hypothetical protein
MGAAHGTARVSEVYSAHVSREANEHEDMRRLVVFAVLTLLGFAVPGLAQDRSFRPVENPFQGEFDYRVNYEIEPMVDVDGVQWSRFAVMLRRDRPLDLERDNPVTIEADLENTNSEKVRVQIIMLFEDADGSPLVRVDYSPVKLGGKRFLEIEQKFKIGGPVLTETRKIYLFCEVQR